MMAHPTPILQTTRFGSRSAVRWLNQPGHVRKVEPNRRRGPPLWSSRKGEPGAKDRGIFSRVTDASLLLVILHYLLKNNIRIYEDDMCRFQHLPRGAVRAEGDTMGSPSHQREVGG